VASKARRGRVRLSRRAAGTLGLGLGVGLGLTLALGPPAARWGLTLSEPPQPPPVLVGEVSRVFDGATIRALLGTGAVERVRYLGVEAPGPAECFGPEALLYNRDALLGRTVWLELDARERDAQGHLLAYVYLDPKGLSMVNAVLIAQGLARASPTLDDGQPLRYGALFAELEAEARAAKRGLWLACPEPPESSESPAPPPPEPEPEPEPRPQPQPGGKPVVIERVRYDAEGDDNQNKNGEWVVLRAQRDVELTGWTLADELGDRGLRSHIFAFPEGFRLGGGQRVKVLTGCGSNTPTELYWCARTQIWDNGEDVVVLKDAQGRVVDRCRYGDPDGSERGKSEYDCEARAYR